MKNEKTLRILSQINLVYAIIKIVYYVFSFILLFWHDSKNPLMPDYLNKYIAFPMIVVFVIFLFIGNYSYSSIKQKRYNFYLILAIFSYSVLYLFFGAYFNQFVNSFNPYGF